MAGYDANVYENVCKKAGHDISVIPNGIFIDPKLNQPIEQKEAACKRCGMSLDQAREMKPKKEKSRKADIATVPEA